jgi:hypothetical protein
MKHLNIRWNPELQEWFCVRGGKTCDHLVQNDALVEMEQFECDLPTTEKANKIGRLGNRTNSRFSVLSCRL